MTTRPPAYLYAVAGLACVLAAHNTSTMSRGRITTKPGKPSPKGKRAKAAKRRSNGK